MGMVSMSENNESSLRVPVQPSESVKKGVSRDDVIMAFKLILGRLPESEKAILSHQVGSLEELRIVLLKSSEFADKYKAIQKPIGKS
jgi:hypothetical protein